MNFRRFILFTLVFFLLTGQASYSFTSISVEVIEKSEDNSEERIEQFTTHQRQKLADRRIAKSGEAVSNREVDLTAKPIHTPHIQTSGKLYLRNRVFRN